MKPYYQDEWVTIYHGDCREILPELPDNSIDLVLTDPPYKTEFIPLYEDLARGAMPIMKDGSLLITLAGQYALDRIIPSMTKHLNWYWIGGMPNNTGSVARNFSRQIMCSWKPVLWFSKGKAIDHNFVFDLFQSKRISRVHHKWEQPTGWFKYYINKLTKDDDLILDPFLGSGTTALASKSINRKCIGIEIEEKYCEISAKRCLQSVMRLE